MLPERITDEKIPSDPTQGRILTVEMYAVMLDEYFATRAGTATGW